MTHHIYNDRDHPTPAPPDTLYIYSEGHPSYDGMSQIEIAKTELRAYRKIVLAITREEEHLIELKGRLTAYPMPSGMHVQVSLSDSTGDGIAKALDHEADVYRNLISALIKEKFIIMKAIESLEYPFDIILLERYTKSFRTVKECVALGYEYSYLCRLHGHALTAYARIRGFSKINMNHH